MPMRPTAIAPTRFPLDELADYHHLAPERLLRLLTQLRIAPHQGSLSVGQKRRLAQWLYERNAGRHASR